MSLRLHLERRHGLKHQRHRRQRQLHLRLAHHRLQPLPPGPCLSGSSQHRPKRSPRIIIIIITAHA